VKSKKRLVGREPRTSFHIAASERWQAETAEAKRKRRGDVPKMRQGRTSLGRWQPQKEGRGSFYFKKDPHTTKAEKKKKPEDGEAHKRLGFLMQSRSSLAGQKHAASSV